MSPANYKTTTVTVPNGGNLSAAVSCNDRYLAGIQIPAGIEGDAIEPYVAYDGANYVPLKGMDGVKIKFVQDGTAAAYFLTSDMMPCVPMIKLHTIAAGANQNQTGDAVITLFLIER